MARIGCLWVRALSLAALERVEPELRDRPLVVTDGRSSRDRVMELSPAARTAGIMLGMTVAQARAVTDTVLVRPFSPEVFHAATGALADVAQTVSARIEITDDGAVLFDCAGSGALCASEADLASILAARAERQGLPAWVGIADSKLAARIVAREGGGVRIVAPGQTRATLAPMPIAFLDPDERLVAILASWGLRRIGDLAALPAGAVAHRLGPAGARLARCARGEDDEPLRCPPMPPAFTEAVELEYGIERMESLLFVVRRLVDRMVGRLALYGLACAALEIHLDLEGGGRHVRRLAMAAPTGESKTLLMLVRSHLEQESPGHAVLGLTIIGTAARLRPVQLDFFQPSGPAPATLAAVIARLASLCGPQAIGAPRRSDSHRPNVAMVAPFSGDGGDGAENIADGAGMCREAHGNDPVVTDLPGSITGAAGAPPATPSIVARVVLRAFRPPLPLQVFESRGRLDYLRGRGFGGRVVHLAGPWRLAGEWWMPDALTREYYDVELSDGGVYRIYRDAGLRQWLADGVYD